MILREPPAEINIDVPFVKKLIHSQFPALSNLEIKFLDAGWDNENYRLGNKYLVRLPRRKLGADLILNEIKWLPKIKDKLPINTSAPIYVGQPEGNYPWYWSIVPWYDGQVAALQPPDENEVFILAGFLKKLHDLQFENAPINEHRGTPLKNKKEDTESRMERLKTKTYLITDKIEHLWKRAINEKFPSEKHLLHGDLHPRNIIVNNKKITAIIDWGDIASGDAATDLCSFWMLFENKKTREEALKMYGASDDLTCRAIGWAIFYGTVFLDTGLGGNPLHLKIGERIFRNLQAL